MPDHKTVDTFHSSIKIKGLHFLPPVITTKRSLELQRYKQQAVKLEKRLETCRILRENLQELLILQPLSEHYQSSESDSIVDIENVLNKKVDFNPRQKRPTLSCDIIDVTEYGTNGIKILDKVSNKDDTSEDSFKSINLKSICSQEISNINLCQEISNANLCPNNCSQLPPTQCYEQILDTIETDLTRLHSVIEPSTNLNSPVNFNKDDSPPPRLIRSNSYILENPSPILLAHLNKCSQDDNSGNEITSLNNKNMFSTENIPFEKSDLNISGDDTYNEINHDINEIESHINDSEINSSAKIEVIQTDISVQHITVDCDKNVCEETDIQKSSLELVDPNCQLLHVLKSIPDDYSKKILDLIEKQQIEQSKTINSENVKTSNHLYQNGSLDCEYILDSQKLLTNNTEYSMEKDNCDEFSFSQSISCLSPDFSGVPTFSEHIIDLENEDLNSEIKDKSLHTNPRRNSETIQKLQMENCRRKLSYRQDTEITTIKQEWAASVIGAHVKGYLTRRLLKTERVQSLINTIKDALICALQLHSADNIDESDVELHRRLINQVTAACYTFHDIFFALTTSEQMSIIATDRRRKLEKEKRPASAPALQQSKSATKLKPRTSFSQSLTKA